MVPIDNFIDDAIKKLRKMEILNCLEIKTYKKDRGVLIEKIEDGYNLYENGFFNREYINIKEEELKKVLKSLRKKEFPRSSMVRFYKLERRYNNK